MKKKRRFILTVATFLLAYVPIVALNSSTWWLGEPELPKKLQKN